jgi:hypothetical protein
VTVLERSWPGPTRGRVRRERAYRLLVVLCLTLFAADLAATLAGIGNGAVTTGFSAAVAPVPVLVWWAYRRAPPELRRPVFLLAWAATLWLCGSLVWEAYYTAGGDTVPRPPGIWDALFVPAQLLVIAALVVALREVLSVRMAASDTLVVVATGAVLAAPFVEHGLSRGTSVASVFTLNRPVLSIVILMLLLSAVLGSVQGVPRSLLMLGLAEVALTIGNLVYAYTAVQGAYQPAAMRWADLCWEGGALTAMLAASLLILRIDSPVRIAPGRRIPQHPVGSRAALLLSLVALGLCLAIVGYGLGHHWSLAAVGLSGSFAIGIAMTARGREAIHTAETAYAQLDASLAETEHTRDALALANEELQRKNVQIEAMHVAFAELLNLADERADGRLRELVEEVGGDLASLLQEQLGSGR